MTPEHILNHHVGYNEKIYRASKKKNPKSTDSCSI